MSEPADNEITREDYLPFHDPADRELVGLDEAAAVAGLTPQQFLAYVDNRWLPQWHGFPDETKQYQWVADPARPKGGTWERRPRWRRGEIKRALEALARTRGIAPQRST